MLMDRSVAERLVANLADLDRQVGELCALVEMIDDLDERKTFRGLVAGIMDASFGVLMPTIREHPHLDPDADTDWGRAMKARSAARSAKTEGDA